MNIELLKASQERIQKLKEAYKKQEMDYEIVSSKLEDKVKAYDKQYSGKKKETKLIHNLGQIPTIMGELSQELSTKSVLLDQVLTLCEQGNYESAAIALGLENKEEIEDVEDFKEQNTTSTLPSVPEQKVQETQVNPQVNEEQQIVSGTPLTTTTSIVQPTIEPTPSVEATQAVVQPTIQPQVNNVAPQVSVTPTIVQPTIKVNAPQPQVTITQPQGNLPMDLVTSTGAIPNQQPPQPTIHPDLTFGSAGWTPQGVVEPNQVQGVSLNINGLGVVSQPGQTPTQPMPTLNPQVNTPKPQTQPQISQPQISQPQVSQPQTNGGLSSLLSSVVGATQVKPQVTQGTSISIDSALSSLQSFVLEEAELGIMEAEDGALDEELN